MAASRTSPLRRADVLIDISSSPRQSGRPSRQSSSVSMNWIHGHLQPDPEDDDSSSSSPPQQRSSSSSQPTIHSELQQDTLKTSTPVAGPSRRTHLCPQCSKSFTRPSKLQDHLAIHSDQRPHVCTHQGCDSAYRTRSKLLDHHRKTHLSVEEQEREKKFVCTHLGDDGTGHICGRRFWTNQHLLRHVEGVHDVATTDIEREDGQGVEFRGAQYRCTEPNCSVVFNKRKRLRRHIWEAHTDHSTDGNGNGNQNDSNLQTEQSALKDRLPFLCSHPNCNKRFPTNSKRKSHYKTHTQDRYTCALPHPPRQSSESSPPPSTEAAVAEGVMTFPTWSSLQSHMREVHPPTCHYPSCNGKIFKNRENLKMHLRRHEEREHQEREREKVQLHLVEEGVREQEDHHEWHEASSDDEGEGDWKKTKSLRTFHCVWRPEAPADGSSHAGDRSGPPCSKSFKSSHALQTHIRVAHLKERPFTCPCGKSYGHKHLLKRHEIKCSHSASHAREKLVERDEGEVSRGEEEEEEVSELEEEEEDDLFRWGGGALPEEMRQSFSSTTTTTTTRRRRRNRREMEKRESQHIISRKEKRKRGERMLATHPTDGDDHDEEEEDDDERGTRMIELLTGRGYAPPLPPSPSPSNPTSTPTTHEGSKQQRHHHSHQHQQHQRILPCPWTRLPPTHPQAGIITPASTLPCEYRFMRIYDVARHLKKVHGVSLRMEEVEGLFDDEERDRLPKRRKRGSLGCGY